MLGGLSGCIDGLGDSGVGVWICGCVGIEEAIETVTGDGGACATSIGLSITDAVG
jgi:hypothetical protein